MIEFILGLIVCLTLSIIFNRYRSREETKVVHKRISEVEHNIYVQFSNIRKEMHPEESEKKVKAESKL